MRLGFYRLREPARAVQAIRPDWEVEVYKPGDVKLGVDPDGQLMTMYGVAAPHEADLIVMQRTGTRALVEFVKWAQAHHVAVIVDSDDAMWAISRDNAAWPSWNNSAPQAAHWRYLDSAMITADLATVTTEALAKRYGDHGRFEVLPNCVPAGALTQVPNRRAEFPDNPTIGWAGFVGTHPHDLLVCGEAILDVVMTTGATVRVLGDAAGAAKQWAVEVEGIDPVAMGEDYYAALTTCDIGMVPLENSVFNRSKSFLKALEYSAQGVPVVCSDTPAHRALLKSGVPLLLADTPARWRDVLCYLIDHPDERAQRGQEAREVVAAKWTYEARAEHWASAWERAMIRAARMRPRPVPAT